MNKVYNVLVFPGGTEIGLEIQRALCHCKEIQLFSAGLDLPNHAPFVFLRHFIVPSIYDPEWLEKLNQVLIDNKIDYLFPAYDDVIVAIAKNSQKLATKIVSSPPETCYITRSKSATYCHLTGSVPLPDIYDNHETVIDFPVFIKPDKGQGSEDTWIIHSNEELESIFDARKDHIILEYLPGEEYTVDCFSDRTKGLLFCSGRERVRTKSGISMSSRQYMDPILIDYAKRISDRLTFYGAWFFQVKRDRLGVFKLLEVAPRIAGTMALHRVMGVNFPLLSIYEQERIPITILANNVSVEIDRALVNRYRHNISFQTVYLDLDDTLIIGGKVNLTILKFVFQCINDRKKIVLLTKHATNVYRTLKMHRLEGIFDNIVRIDKTHNKVDYISNHDAIFIDDSFSERKAVSDQLGIFTFDCSMVELLLDERC